MMTGTLDPLRRWARALKRDAIAVWLAARDARTPLPAKMLALAVAAYALSPIDLIPDFIPILGLLDDLLIVPAGIWLVARMMPAGLMTELRAQAAQTTRPASYAGAAVILMLWLGAAWLVWRALR